MDEPFNRIHERLDKMLGKTQASSLQPPASFLGAPSNRGFRRFSEHGQSLVEFAFLLPIFLIFVFSIMEIGRAWSVKHSLTIAAREGARVLKLPYGANLAYTSEEEVQTAAIKAAEAYLNSVGVPTGPETGTKIFLARMNPGDDGVYYNGDDRTELSYTNGKRGEPVGLIIKYHHETPLPVILRFFQDPQAQPDEQPQTGIAMGVSCFMQHE